MADEKIYTIPLRKEWLKVPEYKRAKKAVMAIKKFIARHMKVRDSETNIKIDSLLSEAVWIRGIKNPPHKITVKAYKKDDSIIVEFVNLPRKFREEDKKLKKKQKKIEEVKKARETEKKKAEEKAKKEKEEKAKEEKEREQEKTEEEKKEEKEKKEKEKVLRNAPIEKTHEFIKPTKAAGAEHRMALEK